MVESSGKRARRGNAQYQRSGGKQQRSECPRSRSPRAFKHSCCIWNKVHVSPVLPDGVNFEDDNPHICVASVMPRICPNDQPKNERNDDDITREGWARCSPYAHDKRDAMVY